MAFKAQWKEVPQEWYMMVNDFSLQSILLFRKNETDCKEKSNPIFCYHQGTLYLCAVNAVRTA
jgi:hypothetical protein